jgi:8-oxo-dGTP pyrophosphatase MutT (NUDIX family)
MPPVPAREAATVMLIRDGADGLEVFMVLRHDKMSFAAGALVFPGGSVEPGEDTLVAAVRETFEECGILLARPIGQENLVTVTALKRIEQSWRTRLARGEAKLADMLSAETLSLATDRLVPFAHWITPEVQPKRFDTRFFLAAAPDDQVGLHDGSESVDSLWIAPLEAVSQAEAGRYKLVFATQLNLLKLGRHTSVSQAMSAARASDVVTVMPVQEESPGDGTRHMRIPVEAGYGGDLFIIRMPPASGA